MRIFGMVSFSTLFLWSFSGVAGDQYATEMATVAACVQRIATAGKQTTPIAIPTKDPNKANYVYESDTESDIEGVLPARSRSTTPSHYLATPSPSTSSALISLSQASTPASRGTSPESPTRSRSASRSSDSRASSRFSSFSFDARGSFFNRYGQRYSN